MQLKLLIGNFELTGQSPVAVEKKIVIRLNRAFGECRKVCQHTSRTMPREMRIGAKPWAADEHSLKNTYNNKIQTLKHVACWWHVVVCHLANFATGFREQKKNSAYFLRTFREQLNTVL